jgi:holo-[acyl-carrier protein] synthase
MLKGHGIDIVPVIRIREMIEQYGPRFLDRVYTSGEQRYCELSLKRRFEHYAGRFAAKEAILKALGTGWRDGIAWTDAEVVVEPSGRPTVKLHNHALEIAEREGIRSWSLSISHTGEQAAASAIATA